MSAQKPDPNLAREEEELLARRIDEIPEMDARGEVIPIEDFLTNVRKEIAQRWAGSERPARRDPQAGRRGVR